MKTELGNIPEPGYKFREDELIREFIEYVNKTYGQHYSQERFQATEFIYDGGHGTGFNIGNVLKYAQRYGKKGTPDEHRKDLMKVLHYALLQLYVHDEMYVKGLDNIFNDCATISTGEDALKAYYEEQVKSDKAWRRKIEMEKTPPKRPLPDTAYVGPA